MVGFAGSRNEVKFLLNLIEVAISLEKIIIDVGLPAVTFSYPQIIRKERNRWAKMCQTLAKKLKRTRIPSEIDVFVI